MELLDDILSGQREAAPAQEVTEDVAKAPEVEVKPESKTEPEEVEATDVNGQKMVPHAALHASKEKVKRYTEQVASFENTLKERDAAWERRLGQILEKLGPKPEQPKQPDYFEDPEGATRHTVQQSVSPQFEKVNQALLANAQLLAEVKYGDDKVAQADQAFMQAVQSRSIDPADYQKVVNAPNIFAAAVQWHQRQLAQQEIGDDPAAFRAKLEAEILEKHGLKPATQQQPAPVMPSNLASARNVGTRAGPQWSGPQTLNDIFKRT